MTLVFDPLQVDVPEEIGCDASDAKTKNVWTKNMLAILQTNAKRESMYRTVRIYDKGKKYLNRATLHHNIFHLSIFSV